MKRIILIMTLLFAANFASAQWEDDMYAGTWKKSQKQLDKEKKEQETAQAQSQHYQEVAAAAEGKELIVSYEEALQRRISAMRESQQMDEAYWELMQQYQSVLEKKYDVNLYNIVVVGKDMWVEPIYITSMFDGSDPAEGVIAYNQDVLQQFLGDGATVTVNENASSTGGDVYNIYYVEDYYDEPRFSVNIGFGWGYGGWGGFYNPWYSPWYGYGWGGGWYDPWYGYGGGWYNPWYGYGGGWYDPWYGPAYGPGGWYRPGYSHHNRNPRGAVYGNSEHRYSRPGGNSAMGGSRNNVSRPNATGVNTVNGIGGRRDGATRTRVPNGGVADNYRNNSGVVGTQTDRRGAGSSTTRNNNNSGANRNVSRPENNNSNRRESVDRNSNNNNSRNNFERPVERPTRSSTSVSRPSGGSHSVSRPTGGVRGGGRR